MLPASSAIDGVLVVSAEPESLEHGPARHHLKDERHEARCRIIEGEEAKEPVAGSDRFDSLHLEQIVEQRGARGAQQDQDHEMPQMRRLRNDPETRSRRRGAAVQRSKLLAFGGRLCAGGEPRKQPRRQELKAARTSSMAGAPSIAATRSETSAPRRPPSVPAPVI